MTNFLIHRAKLEFEKIGESFVDVGCGTQRYGQGLAVVKFQQRVGMQVFLRDG